MEQGDVNKYKGFKNLHYEAFPHKSHEVHGTSVNYNTSERTNTSLVFCTIALFHNMNWP
jgi:hypothetical protein